MCDEHKSSEKMCNTRGPLFGNKDMGTKTLIALSVTVKEQQDAITSSVQNDMFLKRNETAENDT